jgi:LEA14-like dessication related protein
MRKRGIWIILILLILGSIGYYTYVKLTGIKDLKIELIDTRIDNVSLTGITFQITLLLSNPNQVSVTVGRFRAFVYANDVYISTLELAEPIEIKSKQQVEQEITLRINYIDVGIAIVNSIKEKAATWRISGEYELHGPFGLAYPYTFNSTGKIY